MTRNVGAIVNGRLSLEMKLLIRDQMAELFTFALQGVETNLLLECAQA